MHLRRVNITLHSLITSLVNKDPAFSKEILDFICEKKCEWVYSLEMLSILSPETPKNSFHGESSGNMPMPKNNEIRRVPTAFTMELIFWCFSGHHKRHS